MLRDKSDLGLEGGGLRRAGEAAGHFKVFRA